MNAPTLEDAIDNAMTRVVAQVTAALVAGNDAEAGRIIRAEADRQIAEWRELEAPDEISDAELAAAFRDVYAAGRDYEPRTLYAEKKRKQARELWAEMTADMRAHEAGE